MRHPPAWPAVLPLWLLIVLSVLLPGSGVPVRAINVSISCILPTCYPYTLSVMELAIQDVENGLYDYLQDVRVTRLPYGNQCGAE